VRRNGSNGLLENQPPNLYPANSLFVNGYLITPGQEASETHRMIADMGFEIEDRLPN
jgi:biotin synthase